MVSIIFMCMGNICRSPMAEGLFLREIEAKGLREQFEVWSAGMGAWHEGELPDPRMRETAEAHGISLTTRGQQLRPSDVRKADYIICMDDSNRQHALRLMQSRGLACDIRLMGEFDPQTEGETEVPDPYSGEMDGFKVVYEMLERSTPELLKFLKAKHGLE